MPRLARRSFPLAALALTALASAANAQVMVVTDHNRQLSGESTWTDPSGTNTSGLLLTAAPAGEFGQWEASLGIPGFISGNIMQIGGFNGTDTISLDAVSFSLGGGNGPGTSAEATAEIQFVYTFEIPAAATYFTSAGFGVAPPSMVPDTTGMFSGVYTLTGPGGEVFRHETAPDNGYNVVVMDATGALPAGTYTLSFVLGGECSFVSPADDPDGNGVGGGAGGPSPLITFRVEAAGGSCPADWNDDTVVNSTDISEFIVAWLNSLQHGDLNADFNGDNLLNSSDISAFLSTWLDAVQNGC